MAIYSIKMAVPNTSTAFNPYRVNVSLGEDVLRRFLILPLPVSGVVNNFGLRFVSDGRVIVPIPLPGWSDWLDLGDLRDVPVDLYPNIKLNGPPYACVLEGYNTGAGTQYITIVVETAKIPEKDKTPKVAESNEL